MDTKLISNSPEEELPDKKHVEKLSRRKFTIHKYIVVAITIIVGVLLITCAFAVKELSVKRSLAIAVEDIPQVLELMGEYNKSLSQLLLLDEDKYNDTVIEDYATNLQSKLMQQFDIDKERITSQYQYQIDSLQQLDSEIKNERIDELEAQKNIDLIKIDQKEIAMSVSGHVNTYTINVNDKDSIAKFLQDLKEKISINIKTEIISNKEITYYIKDVTSGRVYTNIFNLVKDYNGNVNNYIKENSLFELNIKDERINYRNDSLLNNAATFLGVDVNEMPYNDTRTSYIDANLDGWIILTRAASEKVNSYLSENKKLEWERIVQYNSLIVTLWWLLGIEIILFLFSVIFCRRQAKRMASFTYFLFKKIPTITLKICVTVISAISVIVMYDTFINEISYTHSIYSQIIEYLFYSFVIAVVQIIAITGIVYLVLIKKSYKNELEYKFFHKTRDEKFRVYIARKLKNALRFAYKNKKFVFAIVILVISYSVIVFVSAVFSDDSIFVILAGSIITGIAYYIIIRTVLAYIKIADTIAEVGEGTFTLTKKIKNKYLKPILTLLNINENIKTSVQQKLKSERLKTELIANVSHDLKTPLTSIISYSELLKNGQLDYNVQKDYAEIVHQKALRLKVLIDDLFEISKLSSGQIELVKEDLDIVDLLKQALGELSEKIEESKIDFKFTFSEPHIILKLDGKKVWRVFDNLLNNIIKYAQPSTRAYINVEKIENAAVITMKNTSAFELDFEPQELFERFKRGDKSRTMDGSGLGLNIAQSIIELHGGTMELAIDADLFKISIVFFEENIYS